jgi:hypothetical protein
VDPIGEGVVDWWGQLPLELVVPCVLHSWHLASRMGCTCKYLREALQIPHPKGLRLVARPSVARRASLQPYPIGQIYILGYTTVALISTLLSNCHTLETIYLDRSVNQSVAFVISRYFARYGSMDYHISGVTIKCRPLVSFD